MFGPVARFDFSTVERSSASGSAGAPPTQGCRSASAGAASRVGSSVVARVAARAGLQTQRVADAMSGGVAATPDVPRRSLGASDSGAFVWCQWFVAARIDANESEHGQVRAARLGLLVARTRSLGRLRAASRTLAFLRTAPCQSSAASAGAGRPLVV